jgi:hypothetical protein
VGEGGALQYGKQKETARLMFQVLFDRQQLAIENARRLYTQFADEHNQHKPAEEESSTTVFQLVENLWSFM